MNSNNSYFKNIMPLLIIFIIVNVAIFFLKQKLIQYNIEAAVVFGANCILFLVSSINIAIHQEALKNKNPNVAIRSIMAATMIKLFVVALSVVGYVVIAGQQRNVYGVFCGMALYIIYSYFETKIAMKLKKENGNN